MFDVERFFRVVLRRARWSRMLASLSRVLAVSAATAFVVLFVVLLFADRTVVPKMVGALAAAAVVVLTTGTAGAAWRRAVSPARVLYELDDALGLEARISSLYALWARRRESPFARPLQAVVHRESESWRSVYRLSWRGKMRLGVGALCLAAVVVLPFTSVPHVSLSIGGDEDQVSESVEDAGGSDAALDEGDVQSAGSDDTVTDTDGEENAAANSLLDTFLSRLMVDDGAGQGEPDASVASGDGATSGVPPFGDFLDALLAEFAEAGGRLLRDVERDALAVYGELSDADLAERIAGLLDETDVDRIRSQLQELKARAEETGSLVTGEAAEQPEASSAGAGSTADEGDMSTPLDTGEGTASATQEGTGSTDLQVDGDASSTVDDESGGPEQGSVIGEIVEGYGDDPPAVVEAQVGGSIGSDGSISEYITAGVPVDYGNGSAAEARTFRVDYDRAEAILNARSIPQEAQEIVREYFELISEGDR